MLPHITPISFWDNALSQSQKTLQQQSVNSYNIWQMPVSYWQTVSTIMGLRASTGQQLCQDMLKGCAQFSACKTPTDWLNACLSMQRQCLGTLTHLNVTTHQYRAELWRSWQILATRAAPVGSFSTWQSPALSASMPTFRAQSVPAVPPYVPPVVAPSALPNPSEKPSQPSVVVNSYTQPKGWFVAGKPQAKPTVQATPVAASTPPVQAVAPQVKETEKVTEIRATQVVNEIPKPATQTQNLPFAVGQSYANSGESKVTPGSNLRTESVPSPTIPEPTAGNVVTVASTVSSTANSVMRAGNGASVASAAAATRRSVLARHASRKGRLARAR